VGIFGPPNIEKLKTKRDVKGLIKALGYKKSYYIIEQALDALGEIGDARAVAPMIKILQDAGYYDFILPHVSSALLKIGTPAVEPLIKSIHKDYPRRYLAIEVLGRIGDSRVVEPLVRVLRESDEYTCAAAVTALGLIGDTRAIEPLIPFLYQSSSSLRNSAAKALNQLGWQPSNADEKITFAVALEDWDQCISFGAAAVNPLIAILTDTRVSVMAATALGKIGDVRAVEPLIPLLRYSDENIRYTAIEALGSIADPRAVVPLIDVLRDRKENVRIMAINSLGKIGDLRAVDALVKVFQVETTSNIREVILKVLGNIGDNRCMNVLLAILNSGESVPIRRAAGEAIVSLYHSEKADTDMKAKILEYREKITTHHNDVYCAGHIDYIVPFVEFPL
jgi:HEAT repeat protein